MKKTLFPLAVELIPSKKLRERELKDAIKNFRQVLIELEMVAIITGWYAPKAS